MGRNRLIDNLRGLSVLMVFFFHVSLMWKNLHLFVFKTPPDFGVWGTFWLHFGNYGVDVFFTLSGFLIARSLDRKLDIKRFYLRRFARIVPIYYSVLFLNSLAFWAARHVPTVVAGTQQEVIAWNAANTPYYYAFLASYRPHFGPDLAGHLWSLAVEEHFYLLFPLLVIACRARIVLLSVCVCTALLVWRGALCYAAPEVFYDRMYHATHLRIVGILLGVILYHRRAYFRGWRVAALYLLAAVGFYASFEQLEPNHSYFRTSASLALKTSEWLKHLFPSMAVILLLANFQGLVIKSRWLVLNEKLGRASLSFYVFGYIATCSVSFLFAATQTQYFPSYLCAVTVLTLCLSLGSYAFFERWLFDKIVGKEP